MSVSTTYSYRDRRIFDVLTLVEALRFIFINVFLAFILLFLIIEEVDWAIFSLRAKSNDFIVDNTSWNIRTIF